MTRDQLVKEGEKLTEELFRHFAKLTPHERKAKRARLNAIMDEIADLDNPQPQGDTLYNIVMRGLQSSMKKNGA
jgi:hypothetical protein